MRMQSDISAASSAISAPASPSPANPPPASRRLPALTQRHALVLVAMLLASSLLTGCDTIDTDAIKSAKSTAEAQLLAAARGAKNNAANATGDSGSGGSAEFAATPTMDSIGPDSAKRIYYQFLDDRGGVQFVERLEVVPEA